MGYNRYRYGTANGLKWIMNLMYDRDAIMIAIPLSIPINRIQLPFTTERQKNNGCNLLPIIQLD
jgi:hypothetical protein